MKKNINPYLFSFLLFICLFFILQALTLPEAQAQKTYQLKNPLEKVVGQAEGEQAVAIIIGQIIKMVLSFVGAIALLMFVYGGFIWLTSAGIGERIEKGKNILIWAVIGLIAILASYIAVSFIINALAGQ